ncbi:MAG: UDP-N-acetylmuramoyl-L-alanine--D-glutamate ligase [Candidatus Sumerlaeaceae bacterium]|nr:UDP-N-acetylmuramoyl-L-alanine--D-glutamate ligase [Candidatus Sumerlaeaceae bacterium]
MLVFGAGRSGVSAAGLLRRHGGDVLLFDEHEPAEERKAELAAAGIPAVFGGEPTAVLDRRDAVVMSPGIPTTHRLVIEAVRRGIPVLGEIELAWLFMPPGDRLLAITGTNGKTTTTAWTAHLLRQAGVPVVLAGNIGTAWTGVADRPSADGSPQWHVVEVSSYQLETVETLQPDVAILTNLSPDHLERHGNYNNYINAKRRLLSRMDSGDAFVWNFDNPDSHLFAPSPVFRSFCVSASGDHGRPGAFISNGRIVIRDEAREEIPLVTPAELPLPGRHNLENGMFAALGAFLAGAPPDALISGLKSFAGVEHRIEFCGSSGGVRYFNDSKATNVDSLEKALLSFDGQVVLIAGGRHKGSSYDPLRRLIQQRVRRVITLGEAAPLMEASWGPVVPCERAASMEDAVRRATEAAQPDGIVLLSPACASFDMYRDFEERGAHFKKIVRDLIASQ